MKIKLKLFALALIASIAMQAQPTTEIQKLLASDGSIDDVFGYSVSISGDYAVVGTFADYLVISNPEESTSEGSAYIYYNNAGVWEEQAKLTASDGALGDAFGYSVRISGNTVIIGAYGDDDNGDESGSAYIFEKPASGWVDMTETAKLKPSDGTAEDTFGLSVSISGDVVIVGSPSDDVNGLYSGSAYVFEKPESGWIDMTQTAKLTPTNGAAEALFGRSVSISGNTVLVGASGNDQWGDLTESAYIFEKPVDGWVDMTQTAILTSPDFAPGDRFGKSVSISGDVALVGSFYNDGMGSCYLFEKPGSGWVDMNHTAKLTASDRTFGDKFGYLLSISGNTLIVGAYQDDDNGDNSGSAYIFEKPAGGWTDMTETTKFTASDGAADDNFGRSVCIDGNNAFVGVPFNDENTGAIYVFGPETVCNDFRVDLKNSYDGPLSGGSLEYREGGGSGWQAATEISAGVFCIDTERSKVGLRMTYGPQIQKIGGMPTTSDFTFQTVNVTVALENAGTSVDGGTVDYTSGGWHAFGTTGDNGAGSGAVSKEMLPLQYTFRMKYNGDKENKTELISTSNNLIIFDVADLKSSELNGADEFQLATYPNPFSGNTTIAFSLEETDEVSISIYDISGKLVEIVHNGVLTEGNNKINWDASNVNNGVYFVRLSSNSKVAHQNIVKM